MSDDARWYPSRDEAAGEILAVCQRLYLRGLIAGTDGNVSVRLDEARVLATPAGMPKAQVAALDLVEVALDGRRLAGDRRPSTELAMHLRIYQRRPDVGAVVHAHPPTATGFAVAGEDFMAGVLPEVIFGLGPVPLVPFGMPGTPELADRFEPFLAAGHDVFLMANHGATACGATLAEAFHRMESLEQAARIVLTARLLGRVTPLAAEQVDALLAMRRRAAAPEGER